MMNLQKTFFILVLLFLFEWNNTNAQYNSNLMPIASIDREISISNYGPPSLIKIGKCTKYKKMKGIGMGLMIGGGASFLLGTTLIVIGVSDSSNSNDPYFDGNIDLVIGGFIGMVFGVAGLASGIPLTIIGKNKSKQYCSMDYSSFKIVSKNNNLGIQFNF